MMHSIVGMPTDLLGLYMLLRMRSEGSIIITGVTTLFFCPNTDDVKSWYIDKGDAFMDKPKHKVNQTYSNSGNKSKLPERGQQAPSVTPAPKKKN